mmetsp:Transcript_84305/g.176448  ORF Transcript_84305/g.176448 Transcript_84305/m.176448 type:complete len:221 (+) Transcript_84305:969-1631(+)
MDLEDFVLLDSIVPVGLVGGELHHAPIFHLQVPLRVHVPKCDSSKTGINDQPHFRLPAVRQSESLWRFDDFVPGPFHEVISVFAAKTDVGADGKKALVLVKVQTLFCVRFWAQLSRIGWGQCFAIPWEVENLIGKPMAVLHSHVACSPLPVEALFRILRYNEAPVVHDEFLGLFWAAYGKLETSFNIKASTITAGLKCVVVEKPFLVSRLLALLQRDDVC